MTDPLSLYAEIPGARRVTCRKSGAAAILYTNQAGAPCIAWSRSKRVQRPKSFRFRSDAARAAWAEAQFKAMAQAVDNRAARRESEKAKAEKTMDQIGPGVILYSSWGYDQTNIDWFEVVEVVGKRTLVLQEIGSQRATDSRDSFMSQTCVPDPAKKIGEPFRRRWNGSGVKVSNVASAWIWDGKPKRESWYA